MQKVIECVPNFSEGRKPEVIESIAAAIRGTAGVSLLDVDPGQSTNRTVYTFVGGPDAVVEGAVNAAKVAWKLIDMSKHKGEHPRMGALDVCPFIPVSNATVDECIACSKKFGRRLAEELGVPVFLYGMAAEKGDYRKTLPQIRAGEYEGMDEKLKKEEWEPDFGPAKFVPQWGCTATGVRKFLIAYNVNILGTKEQAHKIALNVREQGRGPQEKGRLRSVQGIGWWLEEQNMAQVSLNLTDMDVTPLHVAYEEVCKDAREIQVGVGGSEIVGLVPLKALLEAADFYIKQEGLMVLEEDQKLKLVIHKMGLSSISKFDPRERVIEYRLEGRIGPLMSLSVQKFVESVAARSPAPGGGSVAALLGALGTALPSMVGQLTYGKKHWEQFDKQARAVIPPLYNLMQEIMPMVDSDTAAFDGYMKATRLPHGTPEEKKKRDQEVEKAVWSTVNSPLNLARTVNRAWEPLLQLSEFGNPNCISDLQVGTRCLEAAIWGAYYNVMTNIGSVEDKEKQEPVVAEISQIANEASANCQKVLHLLEKRRPELSAP